MGASYTKPPITEAVIEVRFGSGLSENELRSYIQKSAARFGHVDEQVEVEFMFGQTQAVKQKFSGARLISTDATEVLMVSSESVVVARHPPYNGWVALKDRASAELARIRKVAPLRKIVRLGVRYINRIDVPLSDNKQFAPDPYLTVFPRRPELLRNQPAEGYSVSLVGCRVGDYMVNINTGTMPPALIDHAAILVDIDAFCAEEMDWPTLEAKLEGIHDVKNDIFEGLITDEARKLFQ